jgi:hypothetical protein
MNKVFCIGMFKTGTSTMGTALQMLGYNVFLSGWQKNEILTDNWYRDPDKWQEHYDTIRKKTEQYDAFEDYPWMWCFKKCHEWYPDAKFILLERDAQDVAMSDINMWKKEGVAEPDIPTAQNFIDRYEMQFKMATEYFEDKDLLKMNISKGDGWEKLCPFLKKEIPYQNFPHSNKGVYNNQDLKNETNYGPYYNI